MYTLITGGATGLGLAIAQHLAEQGQSLILLSRNLERLKQAKQILTEQYDVDVVVYACNMRDHDHLISTAADILAKHSIKALVNNSAANFICPSERLSKNGFKAIFDLVATGTFLLTQSVGKVWIENQVPGSVVSISASYAAGAGPFVVPSAMGKAAIEAMTRSLAVEWAQYGIRLNAIAPGLIPTPGSIKQLIPDPKQVDRMKDQIPQGRFGEPEELAHLASALLDDKMGHLTGEIIRLDGGFFHASGAGPFYNHLKDLPDEVWAYLRKSKAGK